MKITLLLTMGIDRPSGRRYFHLARELVRHGYMVRILALHPDLANCAQRRFVRDGVEIWYVGQMHARKSDSMPERFTPLQLLRVLIASTLGMIWGIICSPADIYHLGKPQPINGLAALLGVVLLRRRRFYVDCDDDEVASNRLTAGWQRAVFAFWQWLLPRLAVGVTVNTQFLADRIRRAGVARIAYVPNGVDLNVWRRPPQAVVDGLRGALGLDGRSIIAYVGTLALHNHPVDLLIDAFTLISTQMPNSTLLLIGGGEDLLPLRGRVEQLGLQDRVYFIGHVAQSSVRGFLSLATLSVDPVYDNDVARARSPLKIFESMALGVPVVTGEVGDRAALLDGGHAGVLVAPNDPGALAEAIRALLNNQQRHQELVSASLKRAQCYTWAALAVQWKAVYHHSPRRDM